MFDSEVLFFFKEKLYGSHFHGFKGYFINLFLSSFLFFFFHQTSRTSHGF